MTKLPQSLEKEIADSAEEYSARIDDSTVVQDVAEDAWTKGGTKHALAVLEKAEKLAEALRGIQASGCYHCSDEAKNALAEWEVWKK